jgi:hypothetical protein
MVLKCPINDDKKIVQIYHLLNPASRLTALWDDFWCRIPSSQLLFSTALLSAEFVGLCKVPKEDSSTTLSIRRVEYGRFSR